MDRSRVTAGKHDRTSTLGWSEPAIFSNFGLRMLGWSRYYYVVSWRDLSAFQWPFNPWPSMRCHFILKSVLLSVWLDFSALLLETNMWKRMKILPWCQQQKLFARDSVCFADIRYGSRAMRSQLFRMCPLPCRFAKKPMIPTCNV